MNISIRGFGYYLPKNLVFNKILIEHYGLDVDEAWIVEKTGIKGRHFADIQETNSDLAVNAIGNAIADSGLNIDDIDGLVLATSSPDFIQPATASVVHGKLGFKKDAFAFDVMSVCSGFVYALCVGASLLKANSSWNHLVIAASEAYSKLISFDDPKSCVLFGDGAGAVILSRGGKGRIIDFKLKCEGENYEKIIIRSGGVTERLSSDSIASDRHLFAMDGKAVSDFIYRAFDDAMAFFGYPDDFRVDLIVPHQANAVLLKNLAQKYGLLEKIVIDLEEIGNTSGASIPIALSRIWESGRLKREMRIGLFGFGGGLAYGMVEIVL